VPYFYAGNYRRATMNYCAIKKTDIADGPGVRVTLFVSGCRHHCKGCFQPETWDFDYGKPYTQETRDELFEALSKSYIKGLTLLGGEPMEPDNQRALVGLLKEMRERLPEKNVWCYTGCVLERDLLSGSESDYRTEVTDEMLSYIDVLVDGEFVLEKRNLMLKFRGSENQRLIDLKKTLTEGRIITLEE
jgi:anaerobic ribonucleoside-triphosphate reductase activating protein